MLVLIRLFTDFVAFRVVVPGVQLGLWDVIPIGKVLSFGVNELPELRLPKHLMDVTAVGVVIPFGLSVIFMLDSSLLSIQGNRS